MLNDQNKIGESNNNSIINQINQNIVNEEKTIKNENMDAESKNSDEDQITKMYLKVVIN